LACQRLPRNLRDAFTACDLFDRVAKRHFFPNLYEDSAKPMELLKNLSIRTKLFLVSVIPSLGLIYLLYNSISGALEQKETTIGVYQDCEDVERLSALLHEFQKERAFYVSYLASDSDADLQRISDQTILTNQALTAVEEIYRQHNKPWEFFIRLDSLDILRRDLETYPGVLNEMKSKVLQEIFTLAQRSRDPGIKNKLHAHLFLLFTKDYFVRARNLLLPYFIEKKFRPGDYTKFVERKGQFELSRTQFLLGASPELRALYEREFSHPTIREVRAALDSFTVNPDYSKNTTANEWWNKSLAVIQAQVNTEQYSLRKIRESAEADLAAINRSVITNLALGGVALVLITLLVSFIIREILFAIAELKRAAQKLALGEIDFAVKVTSRDEMGDLAESFNKMVAVKKQYAETAHKIGKGQYDTPVLVRTDADILGLALNNMKQDLARLSKENDIRTWLLTANGNLNDHIRGEKALPLLASEVIRQLTEILNGQVGALYTRQNEHLKLSGHYAFHRKGQERIIAIGDGLVGQAASNGKEIILKEVPDDYIKVHSALGNAKPKNLIIYPFKYEGEVNGVVEIGSVNEFSPLDLEFLALVSNHIGIAINASQSREILERLLEETQRQSEELETQQEELKQFNEELLEKTQLLEKSEEELKTQQEELQLSNEELVEKAAMLEEQKRNLEFTKLQMEAKAQELEQASQYKTEFLSNMSHELRTPLNSILILAQVLIENRNKTLSSKEIKFAHTIYNSGNDLLSLINEILDLSKIEAGKMELEVNSFSVSMLTQNLTNGFEELARSKKVRFTVRCSEQVHERVLVSDIQRIEQVLKNFLSNAFKFTAPGGKIELVIDEAESGASSRKKSLQSAVSVVSFTVTDTGIGIPEDNLPSIFNAFQQVDGSTKRQYGGTGLGLSISRELANLLGGEIHVKSEVGVGSAFTLYLPSEISPAENSPSEESSLTIRPVQSRKDSAVHDVPAVVTDASHYDDQHLITEGDRKILIMEDDVDFSKVLLEFVHERNYKGIIAHQGNIGLSYARHYKPDAIILDMKLPVVDGSEVLTKLKNDPELRHIPVQIISGFDFRKSGLELGAIDFIQKPATRESVWKALDKMEHFMSRKPRKLLIIEDDIQHNEAVKELIGNGDVKCFSAYSGKEAYDILLANSFDCIIVDLGLPDMTGLSFLEKIRQNQDMNRIPVIVYTGKDVSREDNARLEKLANTVVLKTAFSNERLLDETTLFLHRVESKLPKEKQNIIRKLHKTDEILKNKRVLIVDDDERNVYSLLSALEREGIKCSTAANGEEALASLKKEKAVDLILMDVMMPEMDGFEATKAIRNIASYGKIPIIALTAKAMKDDREKCLAAGMSDYISKPLNVQQLLSLMRVWLYA
jgi:CheY-like chemotaxis protein/HAMP domain-containing protein/putative methionine-R-sulfoxide reductase with GAF domain